MKDNKGFTLTEVLLAAMIVGIIGIALAALTTAALRESSAGRSRIMLRNQISLFLRQLRQDVQQADRAANEAMGQQTLSLSSSTSGVEINYACSCGVEDYCTRTVVRNGSSAGSKKILNHVQCGNSDWPAPAFEILADGTVFKVRLIVGVDGQPPVKESVEESFVLP